MDICRWSSVANRLNLYLVVTVERCFRWLFDEIVKGNNQTIKINGWFVLTMRLFVEIGRKTLEHIDQTHVESKILLWMKDKKRKKRLPTVLIRFNWIDCFVFLSITRRRWTWIKVQLIEMITALSRQIQLIIVVFCEFQRRRKSSMLSSSRTITNFFSKTNKLFYGVWFAVSLSRKSCGTFLVEWVNRTTINVKIEVFVLGRSKFDDRLSSSFSIRHNQFWRQITDQEFLSFDADQLSMHRRQWNTASRYAYTIFTSFKYVSIVWRAKESRLTSITSISIRHR